MVTSQSAAWLQHHPPSVTKTVHHQALSVGRSWQYETSFGSHYMGTGHSWPVSRSFYKCYSGTHPCKIGSGSTTSLVAGWNHVVGLWGQVNHSSQVLGFPPITGDVDWLKVTVKKAYMLRQIIQISVDGSVLVPGDLGHQPVESSSSSSTSSTSKQQQY